MLTWASVWSEVVHVAIGFGLSTLILAPLAALARRKLKALWRTHERTQRRIADSLDPEKPGGITEQLDRLSKEDSVAESKHC